MYYILQLRFFPLLFLALTTISFWKVFDLLPINSLQQHYFENTKSFSKLPYSPLLSPLMVQYMYLRILIYGVNFTGFSSAYLKLHFLAAILNKVRGRQWSCHDIKVGEESLEGFSISALVAWFKSRFSDTHKGHICLVAHHFKSRVREGFLL